jgi:hypothetical protein
MNTEEKTYTSWAKIQEMYPDRFVLLENPTFEYGDIKEAIFLYKHKSRKKVIEKEIELNPYDSALVYTGGIRGDIANKCTFIL